MKNCVFLAKAIIWGIPRLIFLFAVDPRSFVRKVSQRMGGRPKLMAVVQKASVPGAVRQLVRAGEFSDAIRKIEGLSTIPKVLYLPLVIKLKSELAALDFEYTPSLEGGVRMSTGPRCTSAKSTAVVHVFNNSLPFTASGYTVRSQNVLKAQKRAGLRVVGITRPAYPMEIGLFPQREVDVVDGIIYYRTPSRSFIPFSSREIDNYVKHLVNIARISHADILHTTTSFKNAIVVSKAAEILGIPWVYEVRGQLESTWLSKLSDDEQRIGRESEYYSKFQKAETRAMEAASHLVTLSDVHKASLVNRGIDPEKITVIPNGISLRGPKRNSKKKELREYLKLPDGILFGAVSSVVGYEGFDLPIRALKSLPSNYYFVLVGDGEELPVLKELAERLAVTDRVLFVGKQPNSQIERWYEALDVFIIPRRKLTVTEIVTPIKGLQAQALNLPIVASDLPALREITGGLAFYYSPEVLESFVEALLEAIKSGGDDRGHAWAKEHDWDCLASSYKNMYEELLGNG